MNQRGMKYKSLLFIVSLCVTAALNTHAASKCSKSNLTRCLDSACAINLGMNPAARCQYCGTSSAGTAPANKGLTSITAGQSTKYALSDKELKIAPSDPGKRYMWATTECIKKLPDCTTDDVSDTYDKLIEQSCKSAGISMQISSAMEKANKKPTKTKCTETFNLCMNSKCGAAFDTCDSDADFDRFVSECATDATGCDEYITELRKNSANERKRAIDNRENQLQSIVENYKTTREYQLTNARNGCERNTETKSCVETVCAKNMRGKCKTERETSMAEQLCAFYKTACAVLK